MTDAHEAKQATPHALLLAELLDSRIPKSEREHAAKREIERLTAALQHEADCVEAAKAEIERLTDENRRLRADLLAGRNVVNAGLTIHTLTLERDMLRQEIERLTAALRAQPGPVSMDDMEWAGKAHLADCEASNQRLRAALVAAMEIVQQDRMELYYGCACPVTGKPSPEDDAALARYDAVIVQARDAMGREG